MKSNCLGHFIITIIKYCLLKVTTKTFPRCSETLVSFRTQSSGVCWAPWLSLLRNPYFNRKGGGRTGEQGSRNASGSFGFLLCPHKGKAPFSKANPRLQAAQPTSLSLLLPFGECQILWDAVNLPGLSQNLPPVGFCVMQPCGPCVGNKEFSNTAFILARRTYCP